MQVVLATSITSTEAVLRSLPLTRLRRSTLFVDVLSVKEFPKKLLLSTLPQEVRLRTWLPMKWFDGRNDKWPCCWTRTSAMGVNRPFSVLPCHGLRAIHVGSAGRLDTQQLLCGPNSQVDILCTHPMFGPDSGKGSWAGLKFMYEKVRVGGGERRQRRVDQFLQVQAVP